MQIIRNPGRKDWDSLLQRPVLDPLSLEKKVGKILERVRKNGDKALRKLTAEFDEVKIKKLEVSAEEKKSAWENVDSGLRNALQLAKDNIESFHRAQLAPSPVVITMPGIDCWRKPVGIEKVGLYIPGGTAPLFSTVLMLGVPAALAGCKEIVLCTPPQKDGSIHPAILVAAQLAGITRIFKVGGAQAIAAMAFGTDTIPKVYKIFGPGNQYVNCAKQLVQLQNTAIDMPAGPSEVCVLADETANAEFVAADLLSQAEHGADSQVLLVSTSAQLIDDIIKAIDRQLQNLPRKKMAAASLENSKAILIDSPDTAIDLVNAYAAEHLIISCANENEVADKIVNAGSVFLGNYSPESVGDYASGTNHVLPTNGFARAFSGVSVDSFVKKITYQQLTKEGLQSIGPAVMKMAEAEGLLAHAQAVKLRMEM